MKIFEIITEAREAALYHFTSEKNFFRILATNKLKATENRIYFTRDYTRQFLPANIGVGTWGFRINQDLLRQKFGRKLKPGGQISMSDKQRQAWLADPDNQQSIEFQKTQGKGTVTAKNGVDVGAAIRGDMGMKARWESEEHLDINEIPDFKNYITGIVYAGGNMERGLLGGTETDYRKRSTKPEDALQKLAVLLASHFSDKRELRDQLLDYMIKFDIPMVFQRQDYPAKAVKSKIIDYYRKRKQEREERNRPRDWILYADEAGDKKVTVSTAYRHDARITALTDLKDKFPEGIWGFKDPDTGYETWLKTPVKDPYQMTMDIDRERSTDPYVKPK